MKRIEEKKYNENNDFSIKRIYKGMLNENENKKFNNEKLTESEESLVNIVKKKNSSEINNSNIKKYLNKLKEKAKTNINEYKKTLDIEKNKKRISNENFVLQNLNKSLMNNGAYINRLLNQEEYEYTEQDIKNIEDLKNRFFENKTIESEEQKNKYNKLLLFIKRQKKKLQEKQEKEKLNKLTKNINEQTKFTGNEKENIEQLLKDIDNINQTITAKIQEIEQMKTGSQKLDSWIDSELIKLQDKIKKINDKIDELKQKYNTNKSKNVKEKVKFQLLNKKRVLKGGISSENLNIISLRYNILQELKELIKDIEHILTIDIVQIIEEIENIKRYEKFVKDKDELEGNYETIFDEIAIEVVNHLFDTLNTRNTIEYNFASGTIKKTIETKYKEFMLITESEINNLSLLLSYITNYVLFYVIYFSLSNENNSHTPLSIQSQSKSKNSIFGDPNLERLTITTTNKRHVTDPKKIQKGGVNEKELLTIINKCNEFSKVKKSEDYNIILLDIRTNKYLYDLLLFLYLNLFKTIISIQSSAKKIIDSLPTNYQKVDIYFLKMKLKLDGVKSDIDRSIEENIKKIKYISRNDKSVEKLKYKVRKIRYRLPDEPNIELKVDESTLIPLTDSLPQNKSLLERIWEIIKPKVSIKNTRRNADMVRKVKTEEELKNEEIEKMIADINQLYASLDTLIEKAGKSIFLQTKSDIYKKLLKQFPKFIEETQKLYKSIEEKIKNIKNLQSKIPKINKNKLSLG